MKNQFPPNTMSEFQPLEFFLIDQSNSEIVSWIMDQAGVLRAVFKVASVPTDEPDTIKIGDNMIWFRFDDDCMNISCKDAICSNYYKEKAISLQFKDGTAGIFIRMGNKINCYHFQFEESPDWNTLKSAPNKPESSLLTAEMQKEEVKVLNENMDALDKFSKGREDAMAKLEEKYNKGKEPEKFSKGKEPEKPSKGKEPEKSSKGKEPEKFSKGKEPEKFSKGKEPEKFSKGKEPEKSTNGGGTVIQKLNAKSEEFVPSVANYD